MLRRGTGGYYVNGVVARFPAAGISLRDRGDVRARRRTSRFRIWRRRISRPQRTTSPSTPALFQANTATPATQFALDAAGNSLTLGTVTAASLFIGRFPPQGSVPSGIGGFDFTPAAGAPIATGGLTRSPARLRRRPARSSCRRRTWAPSRLAARSGGRAGPSTSARRSRVRMRVQLLVVSILRRARHSASRPGVNAARRPPTRPPFAPTRFASIRSRERGRIRSTARSRDTSSTRFFRSRRRSGASRRRSAASRSLGSRTPAPRARRWYAASCATWPAATASTLRQRR